MALPRPARGACWARCSPSLGDRSCWRWRRAGEDVALVGGAVRDLLLGRAPRELDVVVAGSAATLARELSSCLAAVTAESPTATVHERFGTAMLLWDGGRVDIAARRAESYAAPGRAAGRAHGHERRGPRAPGLHGQCDRGGAGRRAQGRAELRRARARGSRRRASARPARAQLHRRSHAPAARGALSRATGLRARAETAALASRRWRRGL